MLTATASIVIPWITVILAYFTRPIGYGCRSIYLTGICSVWTLNSLIAYILHVKGEENVFGYQSIHGLFCISGAAVAVFLFLLGLLSHTPEWWVHMFGHACDTSD